MFKVVVAHVKEWENQRRDRDRGDKTKAKLLDIEWCGITLGWIDEDKKWDRYEKMMKEIKESQQANVRLMLCKR